MLDMNKLPTASNVGESERVASLVSGALLALYGLVRRSPASMALLPGAAYMLYRGASGHCYVYDLLGVTDVRRGSTLLPADAPPPPAVEDGDEVIESSWESFPTSDPPAWTMGREKRNQE